MHRRPGWQLLLLLLPLAYGLAQLRFDADVLGLLPRDVPAAQGLRLYQEHFTKAGELVVTVSGSDTEKTLQAAQAIARALDAASNLVQSVVWQPPWIEHPEAIPELLAHIWLNQTPDAFSKLAGKLAPERAAATLEATLEELASSMSPLEIARLSYDPFGLSRLPETGQLPFAGANGSLGQEMFVSHDGRFRVLFVNALPDLTDYRACINWVASVQTIARSAAGTGTTVGFTGRPAFVAEMAAGMKRDIAGSVAGTACLIAVLFWAAHRRIKPMLWLLTLLGVILLGTLAIGGMVFGTINVISMGFAAILLGLAVDYGVVHYQEALAHPNLTIPQIRRAIAPSILWAAVTTIASFAVLNFGGLPGLAQLGSLVAIGITLSAAVMVFAFLPPLFPDRMGSMPEPGRREGPERGPSATATAEAPVSTRAKTNPKRLLLPLTTLAVVCVIVVILANGLPRLDGSSRALNAGGSQAQAVLDTMRTRLGTGGEPILLLVQGRDETDLATRLDRVRATVEPLGKAGALAATLFPTDLLARPLHQASNRSTAAYLVSQRESLRAAGTSVGFAQDALKLGERVLDGWAIATASDKPSWPTNAMCRWILDRVSARTSNECFAVAFLLTPPGKEAGPLLDRLEKLLPPGDAWVVSWELLGSRVLGVVKGNLWKLVVPMLTLVLVSLYLAFRDWRDIALSISVLAMSGLSLVATMSLFGWSWNLMNLMALPLILGTGVDYSLFMILALHRHHGDRGTVHASVGKALLLCGATATAGFGMLGFSSIEGMASLGRVCALGIGWNMIIAIFLLPDWWRAWVGSADPNTRQKPSSLYRAVPWHLGLLAARRLSPRVLQAIAWIAGSLYPLLARSRAGIVRENLRPFFGGDRSSAAQASRRLFRNFAQKLVDLWRFEAGVAGPELLSTWSGWNSFLAAHGRGRGVLIVTVHLGNWEMGSAHFSRMKVPLLVLTQPEPDDELTRLRQSARARLGVDTVVVREDPFAFVEVIQRLQSGGTVALLVDRPGLVHAVAVPMLGRRVLASLAPAELARASGCAILPAVIIRHGDGYHSELLPELAYHRDRLGSREERARLASEVMMTFEPYLKKHADQWYHFTPAWEPAEAREHANPG